MLEDVHWAEPTLLELVGHLIEIGRAPMFVLCLARPEFATADLPLGDVLHLPELGDAESRALLDARDSGTAVDDALRARVLEVAEGNPLFLEELFAMVAEGGAAVDAGGAMPTTIQSLLVARLERLEPGECRVAELASVEGRAFHRDAVRELADDPTREHVPGHLASLERARLITTEDRRCRGARSSRSDTS